VGSNFYRDRKDLRCVGHPRCEPPCVYEPDEQILEAVQEAYRKRRLSKEEVRCIELDLEGYPSSVILQQPGPDPTGKVSHRAKYACERAYAKVGRRVCWKCQMLYSLERPKGPLVDEGMKLRYPVTSFPFIRERQAEGPIKIKRMKGKPTAYEG